MNGRAFKIHEPFIYFKSLNGPRSRSYFRLAESRASGE